MIQKKDQDNIQMVFYRRFEFLPGCSEIIPVEYGCFNATHEENHFFSFQNHLFFFAFSNLVTFIFSLIFVFNTFISLNFCVFKPLSFQL